MGMVPCRSASLFAALLILAPVVLRAQVVLPRIPLSPVPSVALPSILHAPVLPPLLSPSLQGPNLSMPVPLTPLNAPAPRRSPSPAMTTPEPASKGRAGTAFVLAALQDFSRSSEDLAKSRLLDTDDLPALLSFLQEASSAYRAGVFARAPDAEAAETAAQLVEAFVRLMAAGADVALTFDELTYDVAPYRRALDLELRKSVRSGSLAEVRSTLETFVSDAERKLRSPASPADDAEPLDERNLPGVYVLSLHGGEVRYRIRLRSDGTAYILNAPSGAAPPIRLQNWTFADGVLSFYVDEMLASQIVLGPVSVGEFRRGSATTYRMFSYPGPRAWDAPCTLTRYDPPSGAGKDWR